MRPQSGLEKMQSTDRVSSIVSIWLSSSALITSELDPKVTNSWFCLYSVPPVLALVRNGGACCGLGGRNLVAHITS